MRPAKKRVIIVKNLKDAKASIERKNMARIKRAQILARILGHIALNEQKCNELIDKRKHEILSMSKEEIVENYIDIEEILFEAIWFCNLRKEL